MITLSGSLLYDFYNEVEPIFAVEPIRDQEIGGLIMWVPGQMMFIIAAGIVFAVWAHKAEQRQQAEDAERLAAARAGATPS
jgi:cytochrome c oxidase assembly factor CtaG